MQRFLFPGFCTARSMKLQIQLTYYTPEKAYGLRDVDGKTRRFILTMSHVIKVLGKLNKYEQHFFNHILYQDHAKFYVYNMPNNKANDM